MFLEDSETLYDHVVIINTHIHEKAKLKRGEFLERVECVKGIRTLRKSGYLNFYISSLEENLNWKKFHDIVQKGAFNFEDDYIFALAFEPKLYNWLKETKLEIIQKQIIVWQAGIYLSDITKQEIIEKQLYHPLLEEVKKTIARYFRGFAIDFNLLFEKWEKDDDETFLEETEKFKQTYLDVCKEFYGSEPPEFLKSPFGYEYVGGWGLTKSDFYPQYSFDVIEAYFSSTDWNNVVIKGGKDSLIRTESRKDLWEKWRHSYSIFEQEKSFRYNFYNASEELPEGKKRPKRETISATIKKEVWQRDEGKCVVCGSNEKLEFDHIIPVTKGGSSTVRNLQLLCEKHNREKHSNFTY
jgi:hypothetical protein